MLRNSPRLPHKTARGMTLVETVVAITVMALVLTVSYQTFQQAMRVYHRYEKSQWYEQNLRASWSMMGRDIRCAYASGTPATTFVGTRDSLSFTTLGDGSHPERGGLETVTYQIDQTKGLIKKTAGFMADSATYPPAVQQVAPLARKLHLRYLNRDKVWHEEWGTTSAGIPSGQKNQLPFFVEIALTLETPQHQEETIKTVIPVISRTFTRPAL